MAVVDNNNGIAAVDLTLSFYKIQLHTAYGFYPQYQYKLSFCTNSHDILICTVYTYFFIDNTFVILQQATVRITPYQSGIPYGKHIDSQINI